MNIRDFFCEFKKTFYLQLKYLKMRKALLLILMVFPFAVRAGIILTVINHSTCGNNNGAIFSSVTGTAPFVYQWNTGVTTPDAYNLSPGVYTLYVTDANGFMDSASVTILNQPFISGVATTFFSQQVVGFPCPGSCNGRLFVATEASNAILPITPMFAPSNGNPSNTLFYDNTLNKWVVDNVCETDQVEMTFVDATGCPGTVGAQPPLGPSCYLDSFKVEPSCTSNNVGRIYLYNSYASSGLYMASINGVPYGFSTNPVIISSLAPGTYTIDISRDSWTTCDTTFAVTVVDMGNNCGTISGNVIVDSIYNCAIDANEEPIAGEVVYINPGGYLANTDNAGHFTADLPFGTYQIASAGNNLMSPVCSQSGIVLNSTTPVVNNVVLTDTVIVSHDGEVQLAMWAIRPGFSHYENIHVRNNSYRDSINPVVNLTYDPTLILTNASYPYTVISASEIQFQLPYIQRHQSYNIALEFYVPANPLLIGLTMTSMATLSGVTADQIATNNTSTISRVVSGSYDPNEIIAKPGIEQNNYFFMDIDSMINYTIYFQNTGTDTAFNIMIEDSLDEHLIASTFSFLGSSHPCHYSLSGQHTLRFYLDNILLPDSNVNEKESHGFVKYSIRPELYLPINPYQISNMANIYFDFNPAVATNTVVTNMVVSVGIDEKRTVDFKLQPNPVQERLELVTKDNVNIESILIRDISGRVVVNIRNRDKFVDVSSLAAGMYTMQIQYVTSSSSDLHSTVVTFAKK